MTADPARTEAIARALDQVRMRITLAEQTCGRTGEVRLVAVSKTMPADDVLAARAAGQIDFGENYGQEVRDKRATLAGADLRWHFIGPLQTNKIKYVAESMALIHTIDSVNLLDELERRRQGVPGFVDCLVQVNVAAEPQKRGVAPEGLDQLLDHFSGLSRVRCAGLMLIPPFGDNPEIGRPFFSQLRILRDARARISRRNVDLRELSMGMSHDLEVAVAQGATLVRVGTAIFGSRS